MTDKEAKNEVDEVFAKIKQATTTGQIDALISGDIVKYQMDSETYPHLNFNITPADIEELQKADVLTKEGSLPNNFSNNKDLSPITKLLYAVLWKNGDLKKIRHIIQGILDADESTNDKESGLVFYQFGKFLTQTGQPIIDQHVLRSFGIYQNIELPIIDSLRNKSTINKNDKVLIERYKQWLKSDELTRSLRQQPDYSYHIDKLLFALGKMVKKKKVKKV